VLCEKKGGMSMKKTTRSRSCWDKRPKRYEGHYIEDGQKKKAGVCATSITRRPSGQRKEEPQALSGGQGMSPAGGDGVHHDPRKEGPPSVEIMPQRDSSLGKSCMRGGTRDDDAASLIQKGKRTSQINKNGETY